MTFFHTNLGYFKQLPSLQIGHIPTSQAAVSLRHPTLSKCRVVPVMIHRCLTSIGKHPRAPMNLTSKKGVSSCLVRCLFAMKPMTLQWKSHESIFCMHFTLTMIITFHTQTHAVLPSFESMRHMASPSKRRSNMAWARSWLLQLIDSDDFP